MKRFCFLALLMLLSPSAQAGDSISFSVGGHRIHIEASRYCRSTSCASVSISGRSYGGRRDDGDDDRAARVPPPALATAPSPVAPAAKPAPANPPLLPIAAAPPPPLYKPAAVATQPVAAPPPKPMPQPLVMAAPPAPLPPMPAAATAEPVRPAPSVVPQRVSHQTEDEVADAPLGDWQTENKGSVRIVRCGRALCGYVLNQPSEDRGEAVLVNMKPNTNTQWTGSVYSHDSGDTYYGTMAMKGANTLRVEACALGRFYCSGNNWTRIDGSPERLITSRQTLSEPRS